ncbi:MAG: 5'-nucleotidase C-terminal domain-containing protein [Chloroflexota bacterium]
MRVPQVLILALAILAISCFGGPPPPDTLSAVTILHSNDTHASLDLVAQRAALISQARSEVGKDNLLLLDAGDVFAGTPYFTLYHGLADLWFFNYMVYDIMCLGNHEFDEGPTSLAKFLVGAKFSVISANVDLSREPLLAGKTRPYVIIDRAGRKFGVFGLLTEDTSEISSPGPTVKINDHTESARNMVAELQKQGLNRIIALTHIGWDVDLKLAKDVEGIDLIVGGHSHTVPDKYPTLVNSDATPTLVVQAGAYNQYIGRLALKFDKTGIIRQWQGSQLISITDKLPADSACSAKLSEYSAPLAQLKQTVVGKTAVLLDGDREHVRSQETNLGNLIADSMLWRAASLKPDVALMNGGAIRASIPPGDISLGNVLSVLPFNGFYMAVDLSGRQLTAAIENGVSQVEEQAGRFPQVSGLRFTWDPKGQPGNRVRSIEMKTPAGYKLIDTSATYRVIVSNYLAGGGDGYTVFKEAANVINLGYPDYDTLANYIKAMSPVIPRVEGRITRL